MCVLHMFYVDWKYQELPRIILRKPRISSAKFGKDTAVDYMALIWSAKDFALQP